MLFDWLLCQSGLLPDGVQWRASAVRPAGAARHLCEYGGIGASLVALRPRRWIAADRHRCARVPPSALSL